MLQKKDTDILIEKRRFIRLKSIFPVEFIPLRFNNEQIDFVWQQGYTSNISKGGLCLETANIDTPTTNCLNQKGRLLEVCLNIPLKGKPIKTICEVVWINIIEENPIKYQIGLKFNSIKASDLKRILAQVKWLRFSPKTAVITAMILFLTFIVSGFYNYKLRFDNKKLIHDLVILQQEETQVLKSLKEAIKKKKI